MDKLAEQFAIVTGASREVGLRLLEATNGNLEMAVTMQIDGLSPEDGPVPGGQSNSRTTAPDVVDLSGDTGEKPVRPPDPRKWDILNPQPLIPLPTRRRPRGGKSSVFDPFRDFEAETRQQEEMLRTGQVASSSKSKRKTLEDLFRPPIDMMFSGSFHAVREEGQNVGKWLMVNIQNTQEFSCQKLNRDVWSDQTVKSIVKESFVFWQVFHDSEDGLKYSQFYNVKEYPYVAVIDPRTGELLVTWHHLDTLAFCDLVMEFLTNHPLFDAATGQSPPPKKPRKESIIDLDEERQLKAAIDASLAESSSSESQTSPRVKSSENSKNGRTGSKSRTALDKTIDLTAEKARNATPNEVDSESEISVVSDDGFSFSDSDSEKPNTGKQGKQKAAKPKKSVNGSNSAKGANAGADVTLVDITDSGDERNSKDGASRVDQSIIDITDTPVAAKRQGGARSADQSILDVTSDQSVLDDTLLGDTSAADTTYADESTCADEVKIMLRYPDGRRKEVKFEPLDTLRDLQMFVIKEGFSSERYELVTNFPMRRLCLVPIDTSLMEAKLYPRETVFIQER